MSAIHSNAGLPSHGVRRYSTRIKVIIHPHKGTVPIDISNQVTSCRTGKTLKGVGQLNLTVVPKYNYFNLLGPNDYVNVYFDKRDGKGWVRTFFGLIDRLEEELIATENGPQSSYYILCSDFAKVFDRTQIYMNPHVALRDDVFTNGSIGPQTSPRIMLMSAGVLLNGTPADVVANVIYVTAGFGQQFEMPASYQSNGNIAQFIQQNRQDRIATSFNLLTTTEQQRVGGLSGFNNLLNNHLTQVSAASQQLAAVASPSAPTDAFNNYANSLGVSPETLQKSVDSGNGDRLVASRLFNQTASSILGAPVDQGNVSNYAQSALAVGLTAVSPGSRGIVDIINVGTFMEREAIDGYTTSISLQNMQGSVGNALNSLSNDIVNELFYDLRPLSNGPERISVGSDWSTEPDELGGNVGTNGSASGVRYVPTVVMRECPFSTIDYIDASQTKMSLSIASTTALSPAASVNSGTQYQTYGVLYFGAVFSNNPNTPGRHVVTIPNINTQDRMGGIPPTNVTGKKHLDVAVISESEITSMRLGRSDTDVIDILSLSALAYNNNSNGYIMKDFNPLVTPIHIMRHGIRVRQQSTLYARVDGMVSNALSPSSTPAQQAAVQNTVTNQPSAQVAPAPVMSGEIGSPIQGPGGWGSTYGYRVASGFWDYHHGQDIAPRPQGTTKAERAAGRIAGIGTPITAIMDGEIVLSAPNGTWGGYGAVIVLKHPGQGPGGKDLYSVYAHLGVPRRFPNGTPVSTSTPGGPPREGRAVGLDQQSTNKNASMTRALNSNGTYTPSNARVSRGQVIGYMGWTGMQRPSGCHLHFETVFNPGNGLWPTSADPQVRPKDSTIPSSQPQPPGFTYGTVRSLDPQIYFQQKGVNLRKTITQGTIVPYNGSVTVPVVEEEDSTELEAGMVLDGTLDQASATQAANVTNQATQAASQQSLGNAMTTPGGVDTAHSRKLMARWLLLQDHWYQHNPEYLSGEITMRGAPEIRVGYRLDIVERNTSFYVEAVNHQWHFGEDGKMTTTLSVTRGQPNNPYPAYILPRMQGLTGGPNQRLTGSRLANYFIIPDPLAIKRGKFINSQADNFAPVASVNTNVTDEHDTLSAGQETFIESNSTGSLGALGGALNPSNLASLDDIQQMAESITGESLSTDPDQLLTLLSSANNQTGSGVPSLTLPIDGMLTNNTVPQIPAVTDSPAIIEITEPFVIPAPRRGGNT